MNKSRCKMHDVENSSRLGGKLFALSSNSARLAPRGHYLSLPQPTVPRVSRPCRPLPSSCTEPSNGRLVWSRVPNSSTSPVTARPATFQLGYLNSRSPCEPVPSARPTTFASNFKKPRKPCARSLRHGNPSSIPARPLSSFKFKLIALCIVPLMMK